MNVMTKIEDEALTDKARSKVDIAASVLFPLSFVAFNGLYWYAYVNQLV